MGQVLVLELMSPFTVDNENITTERDCKRNFKFFFSLKEFNSDNSEWFPVVKMSLL